jgi:hypothetical protein
VKASLAALFNTRLFSNRWRPFLTRQHKMCTATYPVESIFHHCLSCSTKDWPALACTRGHPKNHGHKFSVSQHPLVLRITTHPPLPAIHRTIPIGTALPCLIDQKTQRANSTSQTTIPAADWLLGAITPSSLRYPPTESENRIKLG